MFYTLYPRVREECGCGNDGTAWSLSDYPTQRNLFFLLSFDATSARDGCARDVEEIILDRSRPVA